MNGAVRLEYVGTAAYPHLPARDVTEAEILNWAQKNDLTLDLAIEFLVNSGQYAEPEKQPDAQPEAEQREE